jgi:hypothetical protein
MAASPTAVTSPKAVIALEIEILMIVAPWSSPVAASARTWTRGVFDNGISVYGFNITLTIPPYDYLDVEGLAGSGIVGALDGVANPTSPPQDGF